MADLLPGGVVDRTERSGFRDESFIAKGASGPWWSHAPSLAHAWGGRSYCAMARIKLDLNNEDERLFIGHF